MGKSELFELTPEQQKAWNKFNKALKNLEGKNLFFYDNYGTLGVADRDKIVGYSDVKENSSDIEDGLFANSNEIKSPFGESWCDDKHFFKISDKWKQKLS